jgi:ribosomal-protein-alanine N-acetyltransferase
VDTIIIGPARIGDAPGIANMSRNLIEPGLPWTWTPRRVATHMRQRHSMVVVARSGTQLAGFVMAQFGNDDVHLTLLGVAETHRSAGVGRKLVAWVEDSAVVAGLFLVKLEVRARNHAARRFYAKVGYKESGVVQGYYSGVEDAIKLSRDLRVTTARD